MVSLNVFFSFDACTEQSSISCVDARAYNTIIKDAHVQQLLRRTMIVIAHGTKYKSNKRKCRHQHEVS